MASNSRQDLIGGLNTITALLEGDDAGQVKGLWLQENRKDGRFARLQGLARKKHIPLHRVSRRELDAMLPDIRHQGAIASITGVAPLDEHSLEGLLQGLDEPALLLVLDGVQDPHNLGACLRSAAAVGAHAVIAPRKRAVGLTPVVRKVASGGAEAVPFIQVTNLGRLIDILNENHIQTIAMDGNSDMDIYQLDLKQPLALVMGAEGEGLRRLSREKCQQLTRIPMTEAVESLNVSVAAAVALFEVRRQRIQTV